MKALVWRGGSLLTLEDIPEPEPAPGEVVVQVVLAGICGSDLHAYRGHDTARTPPLVRGHAAVARTPGRSVMVIGCGSIGLLLVHAAAQSGARVIAADPVPERRRPASLLGAEQVLASAEDAASGSVDVAIDAVGTQDTWTAGVRAVRAGGTVVIVGLAQANGSMPVGDLVRRGISVHGHYAYERGDFDAAISLLATAPPQLDGMPILPLRQGAEAFRRMTSDLNTAVK